VVEVLLEPLLELPSATEDRWAELTSRVASPNPFWEPANARAAARSLPEGTDVQLLSVASDDRMLLALPVTRERRFRRLRVAHLSTWTHAQCCAGNPLVDPEATSDTWSAMLGHLEREGMSWLVLNLVDVHSEAMHSLDLAVRARRRRVRTLDVYERAVVLKRPGEPIEIGLSTRHRSDLRRQRRRLDRELAGEVTARDLLLEGSVEDAVSKFLALEARGWKGRVGTALACRPEEARFFEELCAQLHAESRLEIWSLGTAAQPVALACNLLAGETVVRFKLCYDEDFRRFSPGVQLELEMLAAFERDDRHRWLDSCAAEDNLVYGRIYPQSHTTGTIIVPTGGIGARALAAVTPTAARALHRVRALRPRRR